MTSNIGSQYILNSLDEQAGSKEEIYEKTKKRVMDAAQMTFWPEFMNFIDEYIVFQPLDREQINSIVRLQIDRVKLEVQQAERDYDLNRATALKDTIIERMIGWLHWQSNLENPTTVALNIQSKETQKTQK